MPTAAGTPKVKIAEFQYGYIRWETKLLPLKRIIPNVILVAFIDTCFVVVNFDDLAQANNFRIERRQVVFLCWMQDSNRMVSGTESPADWMPADKPTELSRIKLKTWTRQPGTRLVFSTRSKCLQVLLGPCDSNITKYLCIQIHIFLKSLAKTKACGFIILSARTMATIVNPCHTCLTGRIACISGLGDTSCWMSSSKLNITVKICCVWPSLFSSGIMENQDRVAGCVSWSGVQHPSPRSN